MSGLLGGLFSASKCALPFSSENAKAPVAEKKVQEVPFGQWKDEFRGSKAMNPPKMIPDPYFWLRDETRKDPKVLKHLQKENKYCEAKTRHLSTLTKRLNAEILSHVKETDETPPYPHGDYMYYSRTNKGSSYKIYCRKKTGSDTEEVLLDMNKLAEGKAHCDLGGLAPSPDHTILAYWIDETGYETFTAYFKDLKTGKLIHNGELPAFSGNFCWGADNKTVFYTIQDEAHRPYKVFRHEMGTSNEQDSLLYTEDDGTWWLGIHKTLSGRYLICEVGTTESSEIRLLDLEDQEAELVVVEPREEGVYYDIVDTKDRFYILTNIDGAKNRKLMCAPLETPQREHWEEVMPYDPELSLGRIVAFKDHLVVEGRQGGYSCIWILDTENNEFEKLEGFPDPVAVVEIDEENMEFESPVVRILYLSLVTPTTTFDVDLKTKRMEEIYVKEAPNYDKTQYISERIFAKGHDGTLIPMSMVYKRGSCFEGPNRTPGPLFLQGYGSYGVCNDPYFKTEYIPLLNRGVAIVQTHIRGGSEMGRSWYEEEGKYLTKQNTFKDFISCAEHLIAEGYTTSKQLGITGRSAGGLLMGAVLNMAPHLFKCAIAGVPFVDVLNSMSDPSLPLTCGEWAEWGNPNEEPYFSYMKEYCPYTNVSAQNYPAILVLAGLHDPRVAYWEPTKWVARLRELKTDKNLLLYKIDLHSGHFSASDRYKFIREKAFEYAFLIDQLGLN